MSSSLSPWLAKAVEDYRNKHRVNLSFEHKGGYVQVTQFTSYRDKRKPGYDQLDVWAYAHDKQYRVLVQFEASAINEFEKNHDSFTSYKGGLFQLKAFSFQYTSSYVDRDTLSAQLDLGPKERKLALFIHSFRYLSSKGESDWSPSARKFDVLAAAWIRDILLDEEEKKGSNVGGSILLNTKPAQDDIVTAVADEARKKVMRKGGIARQATDIVLDVTTPSTLQPKADSASRIKSDQLESLDTPPPGTPSPSHNFSPDFISARKLVQRHNVMPQPVADSAGSTPTRLASFPGTSGATVAVDNTRHPGKRKRSVDEQDGLDMEDLEPEQMFTQLSEEAAPISDPPPPSSHASSRSISPDSQEDAIEKSHMAKLAETQGLSLDTQERIRSLFRPASPKPQAPEARRAENLQWTVEAPSIPLLQNEQVFKPSQSTLGAKKRKKARLPQFELSSQVSDDGLDDDTILHDDGDNGERSFGEEEEGALGVRASGIGTMSEQALGEFSGARVENEQERHEQMEDLEMEDAGDLQQPSLDAEADITIMADVSEAILIDDRDLEREDRQRSSDQVQDGKIVLETQSEASEADSASDEGFEFVKLVPRLPTATGLLLPTVKQEQVETEAVLNGAPDPLVKERQALAVSAEVNGDADINDRHEAPGIMLEEDADSVSSTTPEPDVNARLESLQHTAQDESAAEYDRALQAVKRIANDEAVDQIVKVYRAFAKAVQKDWLDRVATAKAATLQSSSMRRRPVYDDEARAVPEKKASDTLTRQQKALSSGSVAGHATSVSGQKRSQVPVLQSKSRRKSSEASASKRSNGSSADKTKPRGSSVASSAGHIARLSEAVQQQVNETQALIKRNIRSTGLSRQDSVDLWYSCSGDFEIAARIALHDVTKSQASEGSQDFNILPTDVQNAYKSCWSYEDDQLIEMPTKNATAQHQLALDDIELRRGKGSVEKRRLFLKEDPIAKRLPRKARYPFNKG